MYVDAHCHLDFPAFDGDRDAVRARAREAGVAGLVVAGVRPADWPAQRALAGPAVKWTAGLHPMCVAEGEDWEAAVAALPDAFAGADAAVGVGETGLDGRFGDRLEAQTAAFRAHLAFARARDLPVVLHVVRAHGAALDVLRGDGVPRAGGMMHAFSGSAEVAEVCVDLGLHVSFAGPIVNANARKLRAAAARVPLDRLLVETDAPDQPLPDGPARNEPACVRRVAAAVAAARGEDEETVLRAAARNAAALFGPFEEGA